MVTSRQVGAGVGAAGVGLIAAEGIQQSAERTSITQRQADWAAVGVSGAGIGLAMAAEAGLVPLSPGKRIAAGGVGTGTLLWWGGRRAGIAPRLVVQPPTEVNLLGPFVSVAVFSMVGAGAATLAGAVT